MTEHYMTASGKLYMISPSGMRKIACALNALNGA